MEIKSKSTTARKGGARPGAGRKKGAKNKIKAELDHKIHVSGLTPLEYLLSIVRDTEQQQKDRAAAAIAAAPYVHAKLSSVEMAGPDGGPLTVEILRFGKD